MLKSLAVARLRRHAGALAAQGDRAATARQACSAALSSYRAALRETAQDAGRLRLALAALSVAAFAALAGLALRAASVL